MLPAWRGAGPADGRTPLNIAAACRYEGMVEIPLERTGVNLDGSDKYGQTLFRLTAEHGPEGVVNILVKRTDIHPNMIYRLDSTVMGCFEWM